MTYQVLARKWRPQDFSSLIGQQAGGDRAAPTRCARAGSPRPTSSRASAASARPPPRASSPRRSTASASPSARPCNDCPTCREITAGADLDVLEIDAATYSKVEQVRELAESLKYGPTRDRYKVVVLDEVHRLSRQAFDALLKIVEEPPPRLVFIFATTEIDAVPATILSRCQEFHFRRVSVRELADAPRPRSAAPRRSRRARARCALLARAGEGSVRDAVALLDQLATFGNGRVDEEEAARLLGGLDLALFDRLLGAILAGDAPRRLGARPRGRGAGLGSAPGPRPLPRLLSRRAPPRARRRRRPRSSCPPTSARRSAGGSRPTSLRGPAAPAPPSARERGERAPQRRRSARPRARLAARRRAAEAGRASRTLLAGGAGSTAPDRGGAAAAAACRPHPRRPRRPATAPTPRARAAAGRARAGGGAGAAPAGAAAAPAASPTGRRAARRRRARVRARRCRRAGRRALLRGARAAPADARRAARRRRVQLRRRARSRSPTPPATTWSPRRSRAPPTASVLDAAVAAVFGAGARWRPRDTPRARRRGPPAAADPPPTPRRRRRPAAREHPRVQAVLEIFGGSIAAVEAGRGRSPESPNEHPEADEAGPADAGAHAARARGARGRGRRRRRHGHGEDERPQAACSRSRSTAR